MVRVIDAKHVRDYVIWLRFQDGTEGEVNLKDELYGDVFEPLKNREYFKSFIVHPEWHTIVWPNRRRLRSGVFVFYSSGSRLDFLSFTQPLPPSPH